MSLVISTVLAVPAIWVSVLAIEGNPVPGVAQRNRQNEAQFFQNVTSGYYDDAKRAIGLTVAGSDADTYAQLVYRAFTATSSVGGMSAKSHISFRWENGNLVGCTTRCFEISQVEFDEEHRIRTFSIAGVPLRAFLIPSPRAEQYDRDVSVKLVGVFPNLFDQKLVALFRVRSVAKDTTINFGSFEFLDSKKFGTAQSVAAGGDALLHQGQPTFVYVDSVPSDAIWISFEATNAKSGLRRIWIDITS